MPEFKSNERTFQGVLLTAFNKIIEENPTFNFSPAEQEQNVGVGESRFSDTILSSSADSNLKVFVELKNSSWDATDEELNNQTKKIFLSELSIFCDKIFQILSKDFKTYGTQIKNVLKSLRSPASYLAVYRDMVLS